MAKQQNPSKHDLLTELTSIIDRANECKCGEASFALGQLFILISNSKEGEELPSLESFKSANGATFYQLIEKIERAEELNEQRDAAAIVQDAPVSAAAGGPVAIGAASLDQPTIIHDDGILRALSMSGVILDKPYCFKTVGGETVLMLNSVKNKATLTPYQVEQILKAAANKGINTIDMGNNNFNNEILAAILKHIPAGLTKLVLDGNEFAKSDITKLQDFTASHPKCAISAKNSTFCVPTADFVYTPLPTPAVSALLVEEARLKSSSDRFVKEMADRLKSSWMPSHEWPEVAAQAHELIKGIRNSSFAIPDSLKLLMELFNIETHDKDVALQGLDAKLSNPLHHDGAWDYAPPHPG